MNERKSEELKFSVIIPTLDNPKQLEEVLVALDMQSLRATEIIVSDSSATRVIEDLCKDFISTTPIIYSRCGRAFSLDRMKIKLKQIFSSKEFSEDKKGRAFPYEATNHGAQLAKFSWLAFLDATTIPKISWLSSCAQIIKQKDIDIVFGATQYKAKTSFQNLLLASSFGRKPVESIPGTVIKKNCFKSNDQIIEGVRSGGDLEWRERMKEKYKWFFINEPSVEYSHLATNLFSAIKKVFIYQFYGALLDIQRNVKTAYLILTLILLSLVFPRWNYLVGWDSAFYLPNITKWYLITLIVIFFFYSIVNKIIFKRINNSTFFKMLKIIIFLFSIYAILSWNRVIGIWFEESSLYVPHITKIYFLILLCASILYRGIYFPKKHGIQNQYLFPMRWIIVGFVGLVLDIAKTPGYIFGSFIPLFMKKNHSKEK